MKANEPNNEVEESSYALLVRSEEKKRTYFEMIIYSLILLSAVAAILQFAEQPDPLPLSAIPGSAVVQPG
jgi:hypothetical protein